jgi:hypothetical protein
MAGLSSTFWPRGSGISHHSAPLGWKLASLTLKDAHWRGAGGVGFNAFQRIAKGEWVPRVHLGLGRPCGPGFDPVDQVTILWNYKTGLQGGLGGKRRRCLWMSEGLLLLQLDPLDHPFDPEGQVPTLWARTSWSTGSGGRHVKGQPPDPGQINGS